eukprot:8704010-Pyramimonas_sp.AAC.1
MYLDKDVTGTSCSGSNSLGPILIAASGRTDIWPSMVKRHCDAPSCELTQVTLPIVAKCWRAS